MPKTRKSQSAQAEGQGGRVGIRAHKTAASRCANRLMPKKRVLQTDRPIESEVGLS